MGFERWKRERPLQRVGFHRDMEEKLKKEIGAAISAAIIMTTWYFVTKPTRAVPPLPEFMPIIEIGAPKITHRR